MEVSRFTPRPLYPRIKELEPTKKEVVPSFSFLLNDAFTTGKDSKRPIGISNMIITAQFGMMWKLQGKVLYIGSVVGFYFSV
jgi:hypothetical protein